jgi:perosamine synthetase
MQNTERRFRVQPRREYLIRLLRFAGLVLATQPLLYGLLARVCDLTGKELDVVVGGAVRGFAHTAQNSPGRAFLQRFRCRPSAPLLALLAHRLRTFDASRLARRARAGEMLACSLPAVLRHPGRSANSRTHWLFPVLSPDPEGLVRRLRSAGFDASRATSNIAVAEAPPYRPELEPAAAKKMMRDVVFLPAYPELPTTELKRLAEILAIATALSPQGDAASSKSPGCA